MAYSLDFRRQVVGDYEAGAGSLRTLAERYGVDKNTVDEWVKLYRETGSLEQRRGKRRGRKPQFRGKALEQLRALVEEDDTRTLAELQRLLQERHNIITSDTTISRALKYTLKLPRKKNIPRNGG